MAGISASGIGSGLDVQGIVSQLMALERQPLVEVQKRQKTFESQLSAYGQLKSALSSLQSAMSDLSDLDSFEAYSASSTDEDVLTVSADSDASKGTFDITVNALAYAQKLRTAGITDANDDFSSGTLTISANGESFDITVDSTANGLADIRDAINSSSDNIGVTASIIDDGTNQYLSLTSDETGTDYEMTVTYSEDGTYTGSSSLSVFEYDSATATGNMTEVTAAADASITIDNDITVSSSSNSVSDVIDGVTLDLVELGSSTITIEPDETAITESVQSFVDAYNALQTKMSSLRDGALSGDNTILSIQSQLRTLINTEPEGLSTSLAYLSQVGIKTNSDGTLSLDTSDLSDALADDFAGVAELFANDDQGYAYRMEDLIDTMLDYDNIIDAREDGLNDSIDRMKDQQEQWNYRLELIEERYQKQFTALDSSLAAMQSTSAYLSQQLAGLM